MLHESKQKGGKIVYAWAVEGDADADNIESNTFKQEWPYKSGKWITIPEVDKAGWFKVEEAKEKINAAQVAFIEELVDGVQSIYTILNHDHRRLYFLE